MSKRKKHHEEHIDESWLIPYADLLTLLLALFIVLFASSSIDAKKFSEIATAFNEAFKGSTSLFEQPSQVPPPEPKSSKLPEPAPQKTPEQEQKDKEQQQKDQKETEEMEKLKRSFEQYINENNLNEQIQTELLADGLKVTIRDVAFFKSGSADVLPESKKIAAAMSTVLAQASREVVVSGHTDNLPINKNGFDSNWDLSAKRAINFMKILLENNKLDPAKFSAVGYGEYRPVDKNDTQEGRAKNRRVELMIQKNK